MAATRDGGGVVRHVDARRAPGVAGGPRHRAAVIAFAGADERRARPDGALLQERFDGEPGAEQLEGVETEAAGLVFGEETSDT